MVLFLFICLFIYLFMSLFLSFLEGGGGGGGKIEKYLPNGEWYCWRDF